MNNNTYYLNRIIKLISPITFQTFKIELNGEENELRELLGTILEINPNSIKGLRDSYNNYYTLSSAVKNPNINRDPYNYYTVVIKGLGQSNKIKYMKYPSFNLLNRDKINSHPQKYYDDEQEENSNTTNMKFLYQKTNRSIKNDDSYINKDLLKFAEDLHKKNYIDHNVESKLKKLIKENNKEVISILNSYLNTNSHKNYDELAKKIRPVLSIHSHKSENLEEFKQNSSLSSEHSDNSKNANTNTNKNTSKKKSKKNNNDKKIIKKKIVSNEEKILNDVKLNFTKEKYSKLKELLEKKDQNIVKVIKNFEKNNDYNHLLSKLSRLVENTSESSEEENKSDKTDKSNENDSSYYIRKGDSQNSDKKTKKGKNKLDSEEIEKVSKNICNALKNKGKDIYYIAKYDIDKINNDEKISLFTKQFKLDLDKLRSDNFKIPKKNISKIKNYYSQYIIKKVCKNFDENEKLLYERILSDNEENNLIIRHYEDLQNHQNLSELRNQIKKTIKETAERIEEEENEEDDDDNKGKNYIKEVNEENEDEENEEEEDEEEENEEGEGEEDEDSENKSKTSSNKDNFILKDGNKDRTLNLLNNNYKKINNFTNFNDKNKNNNEDKDEKKDNNDANNQNFGLGFVVVKPKKSIQEEEKKDSIKNIQNEDNNNNKLNSTNSIAKESSQSTNNPNKKLNQFITQIQHLKKIDNIKKTIIDAIHDNNKYVMDLFQKFQKNKFNLNPKSLNEVYKQIKDNPDTNTKEYIFKSLIKDISSLDENTQDFLCEEFLVNKNSELETYYTLYDSSKDKDEFIESIEMFMKKPSTKKSLIKFSLNKIKTENLNLLKKNETDTNEDLIRKSKEITKNLQKYNLINEKEYNIIMNSLENDDDVFTATFQVLFDDQDLNELYETMTLALENQIKKERNKDDNNEVDGDTIKKNYKEIKKNIEEKHYPTLEGLYKNKNDILFIILKDLNSSNIKEKVENVKTLILKKELSAT